MAYVAIYTVGRLKHPYDHPTSKEFYEFGYKVMRQAYLSGNLIDDFSSDVVPISEKDEGQGSPVRTLTVWKSFQSLNRFTYSGRHIQALRNRSKWMGTYPEKHPFYVVWWTEKVKDVSWEEAFKRYHYYIQHGPTAFAFNFKHAFDEKGEEFVLI